MIYWVHKNIGAKMKKFFFFGISIFIWVLSVITTADATIMTYDIGIENIIINTLEVNLKSGDTIGHFSFDNTAAPVDREQDYYSESKVVDRTLHYEPLTDSYSGEFDAWYDTDVYDFEFTHTDLPFQFNFATDSRPICFGGGGIYFNTANNIITTDSFYIWKDNEWFPSEMGINRIVYNNNDMEFFIFTYNIKISSNTVPLPTPEPSTLILLGSGLIGIVSSRKKIINLYLQKITQITRNL